METLVKCNIKDLCMYIDRCIDNNISYQVSEQIENGDDLEIEFNKPFKDTGNFTYKIEKITIADGDYLAIAYFGGSWSTRLLYIADMTTEEMSKEILSTINNTKWNEKTFCFVRTDLAQYNN